MSAAAFAIWPVRSARRTEIKVGHATRGPLECIARSRGPPLSPPYGMGPSLPAKAGSGQRKTRWPRGATGATETQQNS